MQRDGRSALSGLLSINLSWSFTTSLPKDKFSKKNLPTYILRTFDKIKPIINTQGRILLIANPNKDENTSIPEFPKYLVFIPKCLSQNPHSDACI
jgi:hypothetical protein